MQQQILKSIIKEVVETDDILSYLKKEIADIATSFANLVILHYKKYAVHIAKGLIYHKTFEQIDNSFDLSEFDAEKLKLLELLDENIIMKPIFDYIDNYTITGIKPYLLQFCEFSINSRNIDSTESLGFKFNDVKNKADTSILSDKGIKNLAIYFFSGLTGQFEYFTRRSSNLIDIFFNQYEINEAEYTSAFKNRYNVVLTSSYLYSYYSKFLQTVNKITKDTVNTKCWKFVQDVNEHLKLTVPQRTPKHEGDPAYYHVTKSSTKISDESRLNSRNRKLLAQDFIQKHPEINQWHKLHFEQLDTIISEFIRWPRNLEKSIILAKSLDTVIDSADAPIGWLSNNAIELTGGHITYLTAHDAYSMYKKTDNKWRYYPAAADSDGEFKWWLRDGFREGIFYEAFIVGAEPKRIIIDKLDYQSETEKVEKILKQAEIADIPVFLSNGQRLA